MTTEQTGPTGPAATEGTGPDTSGSRSWMGVDHPRYKWVALTNTTVGMLLATINSSIVLISLPGIFTGIRLDPLQPANVSYLLWMLMGYMLVTAVLVVALGRLGDMKGRVRIYNAGFLIFTLTSVVLSLDPFHGPSGALWLIGWRIVQAVGGSMLMANSAAILTDAFPARQRGMALGVNMVAGIAGSFLGLVLGGLLVTWNWRSVFWVNVPIGLVGTLWAYKSLHETGVRRPGRMDWWGNVTFAAGLTALLAAITYGIQPYGGHTMGWTNPWVIAGVAGGVALLAAFCVVEMKVPEPMFPLRLFRNAAFAGGNAATLLGAVARGGLQFMLIIWLQGIWLPLHGYDYADTPLWAGIYMLPLTTGFLLAGPISGALSDKFGARLFAASGFVVMAASFAGLLVLSSDFDYWTFAALIFLNGLGGGLFAAPNTSIIMSSVPADARGAASGMRATFQNAGMVLSMGVFFSLMVAGLSGSLPHTLSSGLTAQGVPADAAHTVAGLPPVGVLFAAFLGYNPIQHLLGPTILTHLSPGAAAHLTGREFFPHLISQPFHHGLVVVFSLAIAMSLAAAAASLIRGRTGVLAATASPGSSPGTSPAPSSPADPATGTATPPAAPAPGVRGRVVDGAGRPVAHAVLTLVDGHGHQRALARSDENGGYTLTGPAPGPVTARESGPGPGTYTLVVAAEGHAPHAVRFTAGLEPVLPDITLAGAHGTGPAADGAVRGTVRHERTGRPLPDVHVTLLDDRGDVVARARTGPDGTYTVRDLAPGAYTVVAAGHPPVTTDVTLADGAAHRVDLDLGHTG